MDMILETALAMSRGLTAGRTWKHPGPPTCLKEPEWSRLEARIHPAPTRPYVSAGAGAAIELKSGKGPRGRDRSPAALLANCKPRNYISRRRQEEYRGVLASGNSRILGEKVEAAG